MKELIEAREQRRREEAARSRAELQAQRLAIFALFTLQSCADAPRSARNIRSTNPAAQHNSRVRDSLVPLVKHIMRIRDGSACVLCGTGEARLAVHHIIPFEEDSARVGDPKNLVTLCHRCHLNRAHGGSWSTVDSALQRELQRIATAQEDAMQTPQELLALVQKRLTTLGRRPGRA